MATWANILSVVTQAKLDVTLKALTQILLQRAPLTGRETADPDIELSLAEGPLSSRWLLQRQLQSARGEVPILLRNGIVRNVVSPAP